MKVNPQQGRDPGHRRRPRALPTFARDGSILPPAAEG